MNERIESKATEIEKYCEELKQILPEDYDEYEKNFEKRAACERYFEKIIEAVVDLAFLCIREKGLRLAEDDKQAFTTLAEAKVISINLEKKLKDAKGMRNILAHAYGSVNNELVFHSLTGELIHDALEFVENGTYLASSDGVG